MASTTETYHKISLISQSRYLYLSSSWSKIDFLDKMISRVLKLQIDELV